ncbi:MAG: hypothetical protein OEY93_11375 [Anaerolineae bacterium]|nr:hypothetical protein [Anaerolineae bacterium]
MAIGPNSYGDAGGVGALAPRWSGAGNDFSATTRPTLDTVESEIDQVSAVLNVLLAEIGFSIPVTQADAKLLLDKFVNAQVAAIVEGINGAGRYALYGEEDGLSSPLALVMREAWDFIEAHAVGLARLGAGRDHALFSGVGCRETDVHGNWVKPLFQRQDFGEKG